MPKSVTAIIPAYNEAPRIQNVLSVIVSHPGITEVIVVDDGSEDNTSEVAKNSGSVVIRHAQNLGKAVSMNDGVRIAQSDILFFCDADIIGLSHSIIDKMLLPVLNQKVVMMIAIHNRPIYYFRFILRFIPLISGQRVLTREVWDSIPAEYIKGFMIEPALNFYARKNGNRIRARLFTPLQQKIKERKYGFWTGFRRRISMTSEIFKTYLKLSLLSLKG